MPNLLNTIKQEPTVFLFSRVLKFIGPHKAKMFTGLFFLSIGFLIESLTPLVIAWLINTISLNGITGENYVHLMGIASLLVVIQVVFLTIRKYSLVAVINATFRATRQYYFSYMVKNVLSLPTTWHSERDSGDIIDKINTASNALRGFSRLLGSILRTLVRFATALIAIVYFVGPNSIFILLALVATFACSIFFDSKLSVITKEGNKLVNKVSAKIFDTLSNVSSITILKARDPVMHGVNEIVSKPPENHLELMNLQQTKWLTTILIFQFFVVFGSLSLYILNQIDSQEVVSIGILSALVLYLTSLSQSFFDFISMYGDFIKHKADFANAEELEKDFVIEEIEKERINLKTSLVTSNLNFNYQQDEDKILALKKINLNINKGEKVALIGQSGSGKTTFLKVLHGLYENVEGDVVIDGEKIEKQLHEIDLGTTLVPQEPELFSSSVRENITFGLDYTDENITTVTDLARFTDVVDMLPKGLESKINEKGVNLSGGQKQRLALARALLFAQDKDIILLDESTSSVDPENENKIYQNIFEHFSGKTFLASIHKMNLLKYFDRIVMFEDGEIIEQGTFDELLAKNQEFKRMWREFTQSQE